jgi:hypothetical protein
MFRRRGQLAPNQLSFDSRHSLAAVACLLLVLCAGRTHADNLRKCPDKEIRVTLEVTERPNLGQLKECRLSYTVACIQNLS